MIKYATPQRWTLLLLIFICAPLVNAQANVGDLAPNFTYSDLNGNMYQLDDYKSKVVFLTFIGYG